jgi:hypothetical protein
VKGVAVRVERGLAHGPVEPGALGEPPRREPPEVLLELRDDERLVAFEMHVHDTERWAWKATIARGPVSTSGAPAF